MVDIVRRILLFLIPFSVAFWFIHEKFEATLVRSIQNGLAGFYSVDGIIFGLIVAFVIQREWEIWTNLSEAVQTEIDATREMWKWSAYAEPSLSEKAKSHLETYLRLLVEGWNKGEVRTRSPEIDAELDKLRSLLASMSLSMENLGVQLRNAFTNLVQARNRRLNYSNQHMPGILKRIVVFTDILLIILSLFIGVNNLYVDYIFTASIGLLVFTLIIVVDDLDNPFRKGTWHLTTEGYENLLLEIERLKTHPLSSSESGEYF
ncbi:MAG: DUF4239 domain-containing protein [Patescibacteria group bacterium]|nr:DUF4239 domain-containing protein [Patescibacteria group bacterium]